MFPEFETLDFSLVTSAQQDEKSVIEANRKNIFIELFIVILFCLSANLMVFNSQSRTFYT